MIPFLIVSISLVCPFLIFLDYHKKKNIHLSFWFLVAFISIVGLLLPLLALNFKMLFAACVPIIFLLFVIVSKVRSKRLKPWNSEKND